MDNLKSEFPELFPFFYSLYSGEGDLIFWKDDGTNRVIHCSEGTLQGDPGGMFFFALGLKTPLQAIEQQAPPDTFIAAFADDIGLGGAKKDCQLLWSIAEQKLQKYGLFLKENALYIPLMENMM